MSSTAPSIALSYSPAGPQFPISENCEMPAITATATLQNIKPDPHVSVLYHWKVTLGFKGGSCVHSLHRTINHPDIASATTQNTFKISFSQIRGGDLTIAVSAQVGATLLTTKSEKLQVTGTNPSTATLMNALIPTEAFKKLMRLESGLRQFRAPDCPLFSADNLGGVGICQITSPAPTDDQVWSWKENLKAGLAFYRSKESVARSYPRHVREGQEFKALVKAYNDKRVGASKPQAPAKAVTIELPDYNQEQLERDTVRGYNGYAGGLHEYRVKLDANGLLDVILDPGAERGLAQWERITAAARIAEYDKRNIPGHHRGDPNYVDDVYAQASF